MPAVGEFSTIRTEIGGVSVGALAKQFGTPTYVYDAARIVERINDLTAFDAIREKLENGTYKAIAEKTTVDVS